MSKVRMKCAHCGKHFKSSSAKQTLCPDCEARERRQRAAAKASGASPSQPTSAPPVAQPKIVGPAAAILVPGMAPAPAEPEPAPAVPHTSRQSASQPRTAGHPAGAPGVKAGKPRAAKSKQPREPKPPTPPFKVTDELRGAIEARYLELAQPVEFDGIRTQIATEMNIPKVAVKRVVQEMRDRMHLPSWWELRAFTGTDEELERIRAAYLPLLPVPDVGIHKQIAEQLDLSPLMVYQGIRRIRAEMRLPQYNPPELHAGQAQPETAHRTAEPTPTATSTP